MRRLISRILFLTALGGLAALGVLLSCGDIRVSLPAANPLDLRELHFRPASIEFVRDLALFTYASPVNDVSPPMPQVVSQSRRDFVLGTWFSSSSICPPTGQLWVKSWLIKIRIWPLFTVFAVYVGFWATQLIRKSRTRTRRGFPVA